MAPDTPPARRHFVVEADETGEYDRERAVGVLADLEAVLSALGGTVTIASQRAKIGEIGSEPVAITTRLVMEWRSHSPLPLEDWTVDPAAPTPVATPDPAPAAAPAPTTLAEAADELLERARASDPDAFELSPEELDPTPVEA